jgi:hypothetical protein
MGYLITHSLANGLTANLSVARAGQYAIYDATGKFLAYAKSIKAAQEFAKNFSVPLAAGL